MCFHSILQIYTLQLLMMHLSQSGGFQKVFFTSNTFFKNKSFCLFFNKLFDLFVYHIRKCDRQCDYVVVVVSESCCHISGYIRVWNMLVSWYLRLPLYWDSSGRLWARMCCILHPPYFFFISLSLSLRWREMGTRRFWAAWVAAVSALWGRDGGTSRSASVG